MDLFGAASPLLRWLGGIVFVHWFLKLLNTIPGLWSLRSQKYQCAVISGATDGIGRAYAKELSRRGVKLLILIGRDPTKLAAVKDELENQVTKVQTIVFDFAETDADYAMLRDQIANANVAVDLLINNVGLSYPSAQYLYEIPPAYIDQLINVNLRSALHLTNILYGPMRVKNRPAKILFLGSAASVIAEPLLVGYAGVKGAIETFCRSLHAEVYGTNVAVQCQCPLMVTSKMSKIRKASLTVPSAAQYVRKGLSSLEGAGNKSFLRSSYPTVSPWPMHRLLLEVVNIMPTILVEKLRLTEQRAIRTRYLKKLKEAQA